jgi:hypothetical protein
LDSGTPIAKQRTMKNDFETGQILCEKTPENNFPELKPLTFAPEEHWSQRFIREYEIKRILWRLQHAQSLVGQMKKQMEILTAA